MAEDQHPQGTAPRTDIEHQIERLQERLAEALADATQDIRDIAYTAHAIEDRFPENQAREREGELLYEQIYDPQGHAEMAERSQATIDRLWARWAAATQDAAPQTPAQARTLQIWMEQPDGQATEVHETQAPATPLSVAEQLDAFRDVLTARRQELAQENGRETPRPHQQERDTGYGY